MSEEGNKYTFLGLATVSSAIYMTYMLMRFIDIQMYRLYIFFSLLRLNDFWQNIIFDDWMTGSNQKYCGSRFKRIKKKIKL